MRKKSFPSLPPLSPQVLHDVEEINHAVQDSLESCSNSFGNFVNPQRALHILRTCLVMSLEVQLDYYRSLPNYHPIWTAVVARDTIDSFLGLFPIFTSGDSFRPHLNKTASEHLKSRALNPPIQLGNKLALPPATVSIAKQIDQLRKECRLTAEELAAKIGIDIRSVQRHLAGKSRPYARHLREYEKQFSKLLNRDVVIGQDAVKMS